MFGWKSKQKEDSFTLETLKKVLKEEREVVKNYIDKEKTSFELEFEQKEKESLKYQLKEKQDEIDKLFDLLNESLKENQKLNNKLNSKQPQIDYSEKFDELKLMLSNQQKVLQDGSTTSSIKQIEQEIIPLNFKTFDEFVKELTPGQKDLLRILIKSQKETTYNKVRNSFVKLGYKESSVGGFLEKLKKKGVEQFIEIKKDKNRVSFRAYEIYKFPKEKKEKVGKKKEKKIVVIDEGQGMMLNKKTTTKKKKVSPTPPSKKKKLSSQSNKTTKLAKLRSSVKGSFNV